MPSPELQESWRRTTTFLLEARSHLSEAAEGVSADEIAQFKEHLSHNELELALDAMERAVFQSPGGTLRVIELMISAADNMGLEEHASRYRAEVDRVQREVEEKWKRDKKP